MGTAAVHSRPMAGRLVHPLTGREPGGIGAWAYAAAGAIFVLTVVVAHLVSPLRAVAPVAYDTTALVLYFDRIVHGVLLETPVPTTPKPLLSLVYGPVWELTGDWRLIVLISVLVSAAAAAMAMLLGWRLAGPAAGLFAGAAIAATSMLVWEALRGLATPWAVLGWMVAGVALTARKPRYGTAGLALAFAALARIETLAIVGAAAVVLVVLAVGPGRLRRPVPRRSWLLLLGLVALPVMLAHDWLLVRDPWYWAGVSGAYSAQNPQPHGIAGVRAVATLLVELLGGMRAMVVLAVPGSVILLRRSAAVGLGLLALAGGVATFMLLIGFLGYVVPARYAAPIVVGIILAASIAVGAAAENLAARLEGLREGRAGGGGWTRAVPALLAVIAVVAALLLTHPLAPLDPSLRRAAHARRALNEAALDTAGAIRSALRDPVMASRTPPVLRVPGQVWPLLALELRLDLEHIRQLPYPPDGVLAETGPQGGPVVLYLRAEDRGGRATGLAVTGPTTVGGVTIVPLASDAGRGWWLLRLDPAAQP